MNARTECHLQTQLGQDKLPFTMPSSKSYLNVQSLSLRKGRLEKQTEWNIVLPGNQKKIFTDVNQYTFLWRNWLSLSLLISHFIGKNYPQTLKDWICIRSKPQCSKGFSLSFYASTVECFSHFWFTTLWAISRCQLHRLFRVFCLAFEFYFLTLLFFWTKWPCLAFSLFHCHK